MSPSSISCDSAADSVLVDVRVTPWVDRADPVNESKIFVFMDPVEMAKHQSKNHHGVVCAETNAAGTKSCICRLEFAPGTRSLAQWLRQPLAALQEHGVSSAHELDMKILKLTGGW